MDTLSLIHAGAGSDSYPRDSTGRDRRDCRIGGELGRERGDLAPVALVDRDGARDAWRSNNDLGKAVVVDVHGGEGTTQGVRGVERSDSPSGGIGLRAIAQPIDRDISARTTCLTDDDVDQAVVVHVRGGQAALGGERRGKASRLVRADRAGRICGHDGHSDLRSGLLRVGYQRQGRGNDQRPARWASLAHWGGPSLRNCRLACSAQASSPITRGY